MSRPDPTRPEAQSRVDLAIAAVDAHGRDKVKTAIEGSRLAFGAAAVAGQSGEHAEARSRGDWELLFSERRAAGKQEIRRQYAAVWPVAEAIVRRFMEFARVRCRELEIADFRNSQNFGIVYRPSGLVAVLHDLVSGLEIRLEQVRESGTFPAPKDATFGIVTL